MDDVVKALLLRLAEYLDAEALWPLADRLEELGDARARDVRAALCYPPVWAQANGAGGVVVTPAVEAALRAVLDLFPERPRWHVEARKRGTRYYTLHRLDRPSLARSSCAMNAKVQPGLIWRVTGPHWPAAAEPRSCGEAQRYSDNSRPR
jgi:hypothetical protein